MLRRGVALGLVAGATCVALEVVARMLALGPPLDAGYGYNVPDPYVPYRRQPSVRITGRTDEFAFDYQHNRDGFRDVEHTPDKPPGVFRIVALGDSFTYGVGAAFEETYLARLAARCFNPNPLAARLLRPPPACVLPSSTRWKPVATIRRSSGFPNATRPVR
jgi:hypothetical protein